MTTINQQPVKLMGTKEVAERLGISKQRVVQLRTDGSLPTPIAEISQGPIWDGEAIEEFLATWDRGVGKPKRAEKDRYVELAYDLPDSRTNFFAALTKSTHPDEAVTNAIKELLRKHPKATNIQEFMQRVITPEKAQRILEKFRAGTWDGWDFGRESSD